METFLRILWLDRGRSLGRALLLGGIGLRYLLLAVQYLPAGILLAWCYERGGSLWSAVLLHMAINGLTLLRIVAG